MLRRRALAPIAALLMLGAAPVAHAASSAVDTTFGTNGETTISLNGGWSNDNGDAVRTADDHIVIAGAESGYGLVVARLTPSGALDTSFDADGITTRAVSGADAGFPRVGAVAVDGANNVYVSATLPATGAGAVYKFTSSGQPDPGFGTGGVVTLHAADGPPGGLRLNPAGTQLLVTDVAGAAGTDLEVHALDPVSGSPDLGFGVSGVATIAFVDRVNVYDLVVRPADGKIIVGGNTLEHGTPSDFTMVIARFTAAGQPDSSFGAGGVYRPFLNASAHLSGAYDLFSVDSSLYAVGYGDDFQSLAMTRITDGGVLDPLFSNGGLNTDYVPNTGGQWNGVSVQGDGGVVVTGGRFDTAGAHALTRRYTASGSIDATFGDSGSGTLAIDGNFPALALVAQPSAPRYVSMSARTIAGKRQVVLTGINPATGGGSTTPGGTTTPPAPVVPPEAPAPPPVPAGCTRSVTIGPLAVSGSCLKREGMTWVTTAGAKVGGLTFVPAGGGAKLTIDPLNLRIATTGNAVIQLDATAYGRRLGPVTVYKGAFDWTWQYKVGLAGLSAFVMPQGGSAVSLSGLSKLPGLSGAGSLPRLADLGFPDFSRLSEANVAKLAASIPSLHTPDVSVPLALLGVASLPELRFRLPSGNALFGFSLGGDVGLKLGERNGVKGVDVSVTMMLPENLGSISGSGSFFVGVDGAVVLDALGFSAPEVGFPGGITAMPVELGYDGATNTWSGRTAVLLGFTANDTKLGGSWLIVNGQLKHIGIVAGGVPLGSVVTLDNLEADLTLGPTRVYGSAALAAGPKIPALGGRIVGIDGTFDFNGDYADVAGSVTVANTELANADVKYWWNGTFEVAGKVQYFLDAADEYGFRGQIKGSASKSAFNVEGSVRFQAKDRFLDGQALVSSRGVAGCATVHGILWSDVRLGAGYKWGASNIDWLGGSCDFSAYRAKVAARGAPAGSSQVVQVARGQKAVSFKVAGAGAAPQFTLTGPGGASVTTPADRGTVINDRFVIVQQPTDATTYVAVARPAKGAWTFTPAPGSSIRGISSAAQLPAPQVKGQIRNGRLHYVVEPASGQTVHFVENGKHVAVELGKAVGRRGQLQLQPAAGPGGPRNIVAVVEYNGLTRSRIVVARYRAPNDPLPAPRVTVRRGTRGRVTAAWTPVPGAAAYRALIAVDGARTQRTVPRTSRRLPIPSVLPAAKVSVTVRALGGPTRVGKPGRATLRAPTPRLRTGKVPKTPR